MAELGAIPARELAEWQAFFRLEAKAAGDAPKTDDEQLRDLLARRAAAGVAAIKAKRRRR